MEEGEGLVSRLRVDTSIDASHRTCAYDAHTVRVYVCVCVYVYTPQTPPMGGAVH